MRGRKVSFDVDEVTREYQKLIKKGYKNKEIAQKLNINYITLWRNLKRHGVFVETPSDKKHPTFAEYQKARASTKNLASAMKQLSIGNRKMREYRKKWGVLGDLPEDHQPGGMFYEQTDE